MALPTVILPGYLAGAVPYQAMEQRLQQAGFPTVTVPLTRWDWLPTLGGRSVTPILERLHQTVQSVLQQHGASQVNLIGHSAGGWLARIYLGEKAYEVHPVDLHRRSTWAAHSQVATLISLGTPHTSQERWTRRNLDFVNLTYPGAFYPHVSYVCIAGKSIYGQRSLRNWVAYNSYQLTCGNGSTWGDGITPIAAAHLDGATNLVLESVIHSPRRGQLWYGSADIMPTWMAYLH